MRAKRLNEQRIPEYLRVRAGEVGNNPIEGVEAAAPGSGSRAAEPQGLRYSRH